MADKHVRASAVQSQCSNVVPEQFVRGDDLRTRGVDCGEVAAESVRHQPVRPSLSGKGARYPDPQSKILAGEDGYVLLTVERGGKMAVEIKSLKNTVLDRQQYERKSRVE